MDNKQEYLTSKLKPILEAILFQLVCERPEDPVPFMINWMKQTGGYTATSLSSTEKEELINGRKELAGYQKREKDEEDKKKKKDNNSYKDEGSSSRSQSKNKDKSDSEDETFDPKLEGIKKKNRARKGISAETYGKFNVKADFQPRFIKKTKEQIERIKTKGMQSFLFSHLDEKDVDIVIGAMDEKCFNSGTAVIKQGDNGDCGYIVDSGDLDCSKCFPDNPSVDKYGKTYHAGEAFGEGALLYNVPRAANIVAKTNSVLFCGDRDTFNNIVKDSAQKKRERYETFLKSVGILSTMDNYEISQVSEALKTMVFKEGEYIIKQGEVGDVFYIIEEGEALAFGNQIGKNAIPELKYGKGNYFGELALIKDQPRAANVIAKSEVKLLALDRHSFKRVLGPIDELLKRNAEKYNKYVKK